MIIRLGCNTIEIGKGWTTTRFSDGAELTALHATQPGQADTAERLGYLTVEELNRDHDLAHSMIAAWLGLPWSSTLHDIAVGAKVDVFEHYIEEQAVLSLQTYANVRGVNLVRVAERMSKG